MEIRAILVSVDYGDILSLSLPYNRHHFSEITVVTTPADTLSRKIAEENGAKVVTTSLFYESGKDDFNKWRALEHGLDRMGRDGWICVMDADIFWPVRVSFPASLRPGTLLTPYRRMAPLTPLIPSEQIWLNYRRHGNIGEWAGYTQLFHASDPVLRGSFPWYDPSWIHAGGADSFFQRRWNLRNKIRPSWEVLHMGANATNWFGRATPYLDGSVPEDGEQRVNRIRETLRRRRESGRTSGDPYRREKSEGGNG